jgi:hypothetical protein
VRLRKLVYRHQHSVYVDASERCSAHKHHRVVRRDIKLSICAVQE